MGRTPRRILIGPRLLAVVIMLATAASAAAAPTRLFFMPGSSSAYARAELAGDAPRVYVIAVNGGQTMTVSLASASPDVSFTVAPASGGSELFVGQPGKEPKWSGLVPAEGEYLITVRFVPPGAHADAKAQFRLTVTMS